VTMADLTIIPDVWERFRADTAFRNATAARRTAQLALRWRLPAWRFNHRMEMRRAIAAWKQYAEAVRRAAK